MTLFCSKLTVKYGLAMVYNNNPAGPRATPSPQIPTTRPRAGSRPTGANVNLPPVEKTGAAVFFALFRCDTPVFLPLTTYPLA